MNTLKEIYEDTKKMKELYKLYKHNFKHSDYINYESYNNGIDRNFTSIHILDMDIISTLIKYDDLFVLNCIINVTTNSNGYDDSEEGILYRCSNLNKFEGIYNKEEGCYTQHVLFFKDISYATMYDIICDVITIHELNELTIKSILTEAMNYLVDNLIINLKEYSIEERNNIIELFKKIIQEQNFRRKWFNKIIFLK